MSAEPKVAVRYANALMSLATERSEVETIVNEMQNFAKIYTEFSEFKAMLRSPIIRADAKLKVIHSVFPGLSELSKAFINKLTQSQREKYLGDIALAFVKMFQASNGIVVAKVESSVALTDQIIAEIKKQIINSPAFKGTKEVILNESVNADLLGGFKITVNDKQVDTSYLTKLTELKRGFGQNLYVKEF